MKAILWDYRYSDMKKSWAAPMLRLAGAFKNAGFIVKNKGISCEGLDAAPYNHEEDNPCDICVYNHADSSEIIGNVVRSRMNLFFKPTVPEEGYATLDELGYGPYSSITYKKPDFENVAGVDEFFAVKVARWIAAKANKWNADFKSAAPEHDGYWLVLGQCGGDSVNTRHDFGNYFTKLDHIVRELLRVSGRKVVVKLHPYTGGEKEDKAFVESVKARLAGAEVYDGKISVHPFIEKCEAVILGNSGAGFEAMMHGKPVIAWGYPEYHWVSYDLRHLADLKRALTLDWFDAGKQRKFLYWYLEKYCFYDQDTANRRVAWLIKQK